jgi:hypothetical protein
MNRNIRTFFQNWQPETCECLIIAEADQGHSDIQPGAKVKERKKLIAQATLQ